MKFLVCMLALLLAQTLAEAAQPTFRDKYNSAAKEMVPSLQIKTCKTIPAKKPPGKEIIECELQLFNALLSLDSMNKRLTGVWLMVDSTQLAHPSDVMRAGGMLLRAARNTHYGDYLAVTADLMNASRKNGWREACIDDQESDAHFCISRNDRAVFDMTLTPIKH